jgi:hypothetical protein
VRGIVESIAVLLQLLGWGVDGLRALRDERSETKRQEKAKQRSANRDADLLQRFTPRPVLRCACTHELSAHGYVGAELGCSLCGCMSFRESNR